MRRPLAWASSLLLAGSLLPAALPARLCAGVVVPGRGQGLKPFAGPRFQAAVSLQLDRFLRLPPVDGLSGLKTLADLPGVSGSELEVERLAARTLLGLLAAPAAAGVEETPEVRARLARRLGGENLKTIEALSSHLHEEGDRRLQDLLLELRSRFGGTSDIEAWLDELFEGSVSAAPKTEAVVVAASSGEDIPPEWKLKKAKTPDAAWNEALRSARESTPAEASRLLALASKGAEVSKVLANSDTKTILEYAGVPGRMVELPDYGRVYRHWVRKAADLDSILATGLLKVGPVSYVDYTGSSAAYIKEIYPDLHGAFFTEPERAADEPRVMNEAAGFWVDFRIPEGVKALSLDGDVVMMIPADVGAFLPIEVVASSAD